MTNATKLADALVEAGIARHLPGSEWAIIGTVGLWQTPNDFINDWRVAGKCLELWPTTINIEQLDMTLDEMLRNPAAICEAFAQAIAAQENEQ